MRNYEGVFIINPDLSPESSRGVVGQIQEQVSKNGGRVDGIQDWGRRRLAYRINKKQEGHYVILNFQLDSPQTKKLEQGFRLNDNLVRFLLVNKDEK
jgi:small subunit ribosomal protein S6